MRYYNHLWVFVQKKKKKTEPAPKSGMSAYRWLCGNDAPLDAAF
jgi:hypothetical protein